MGAKKSDAMQSGSATTKPLQAKAVVVTTEENLFTDESTFTEKYDSQDLANAAVMAHWNLIFF